MREKRQWPRLPLHLNVAFYVQEQERETRSAGTTVNVSAGGLYFTTLNWESLRPGQDLRVRLSGFSAHSGPLFRSLEGRGRILRVDVPEGGDAPYPRAGVAVGFHAPPRLNNHRFS